ncbi:MAG: integrase [Candidatus Rokuibacteriota bacterium]
MATVVKRTWTGRGPTGRRVKKVAWGYSVIVNGRQERRHSAAWSEEDAQRALAARVLGIEAQAERKVVPAAATFEMVAARYLEVKRGRASWRDQKATLDRLLAAFGRNTPVAALSAERIARYQARRKAEASLRRRGADGKPLPVSAATVNRELALLRHLLVLAGEWGHIEKVPKVRLEREPEGRLRFLSEEEIARLLAACGASAHPELYATVQLALNTGMRKGEVLGLSWDRVDFARGVILLEKTKSGRRREVPMNDAVYAVLSARTGEREGRVFSTRSVRNAFEKAVSEARLEDFRFHDLRHTAASHLVMRGASLANVRAVLGHADVKMTMRYAHLSPEHLRSAVARLDGLAARAEGGRVSTRPAQGGRIDLACRANT